MSRSCCMCGEVGAFQPRHHADCIHNKSLQLSAWVQPVEDECSESNRRITG